MNKKTQSQKQQYASVRRKSHEEVINLLTETIEDMDENLTFEMLQLTFELLKKECHLKKIQEKQKNKFI